VLTLTREVGEKIVIGDDVVVTVISVSENGRVRLGIEAPRQIRIDRAEVLEPPGEPRSWGAVGPACLCRLCGPPGERKVGIEKRGRRRTVTGLRRR
jgi:carbon storage regulator CsrA